jgi:hypothetical protein
LTGRYTHLDEGVATVEVLCKIASALPSVCASARRNHLDPWAYLTYALSVLPARRAGADPDDLLPDEWLRARPGAGLAVRTRRPSDGSEPDGYDARAARAPRAKSPGAAPGATSHVHLLLL